MDTASYIVGYKNMLEKAALVFGGTNDVTADEVKKSKRPTAIRVSPDYIKQMVPLQQMKYEQDRKVNEAEHWYSRMWHQFGQWRTDRKYNKGMRNIADQIAKSTPVDENRMRAIMTTNPNAQFMELNEEAFDPAHRERLGQYVHEALTTGDQAWAMTEKFRHAGHGVPIPTKKPVAASATTQPTAPPVTQTAETQATRPAVRTSGDATQQFVNMLRHSPQQKMNQYNNKQYAMLLAQQLGVDPDQARRMANGQYRRDAKGNIRTDLY